MQPHSVAIINLAGYLRQGHQLSSAVIQVDYRNSKGVVQRKIYDANFTASPSSITGGISGRQGYQCRFNMTIKDKEYTLRHGHDPVTERYKVDGADIYGGSISGSRIKNGSFSGKMTSNGKYATVNPSTTGSTYEAKIL